MLDRDEWPMAIFVGFLLLVMVVSLGYFGCQYHRWVEKCERNGGVVKSVNCRDYQAWVCTPDFDTGGVSECHTEYHTTCDQKCIGASAEEVKQ